MASPTLLGMGYRMCVLLDTRPRINRVVCAEHKAAGKLIVLSGHKIRVYIMYFTLVPSI